MTDAEATVVEQRLRIHARPETVWRYWTEPDRMCDWYFLPILATRAATADGHDVEPLG